MNDELPAEFLLDAFPPAIRDTGRALRALILATVPGTVETVRPGWRWIAYSLPEKGRVRNFAWIGPERKHIHLGFEHGTLLADPEHILHGAQERLRHEECSRIGDREDAQNADGPALPGHRAHGKSGRGSRGRQPASVSLARSSTAGPADLRGEGPGVRLFVHERRAGRDRGFADSGIEAVDDRRCRDLFFLDDLDQL